MQLMNENVYIRFFNYTPHVTCDLAIFFIYVIDYKNKIFYANFLFLRKNIFVVH